LFFMPQVNVALTQSGEANQQAPGIWIPREPYFFMPLFVGILAGVVLLVAGRELRSGLRRFLLASCAWTVCLYAVLCAWEFLGSGFFFEYVWYFSAFLVPMSACLAGVLAATLSLLRMRFRTAAAFAATTLATLGPLVWFYRGDSPTRIANGLTATPYILLTSCMCVALLLVTTIRLRRLRGLAAVGAVVAFLAVAYGLDSSLGTWIDGKSDPSTGNLYALGMQEVKFLRGHGFRKELPHFWYDQASPPTGVDTAIQSLYYYSYTYVGVSMPTIDADFRNRVKLFRPDSLVLLCPTQGCRRSTKALRRAGYRIHLRDERMLRSGDLRVWLLIYSFATPA
jgi:hypothetical protein